MGILSAVGRALRAPKVVVRRSDYTVDGSAEDMIRPLIAEIVGVGPIETRRVSNEQYFEGVISTDQRDECCAILEAGFGPAAKPFGQRPAFEPGLDELVDSRGGIDRDQSLYLRCFRGDDGVAFAALWPWSDGSSITLKVGIYD